MRSMVRMLTFAACLASFGSVSPSATQSLSPKYTVVHGWPQIPVGRILGQATGVDIDSAGNVYVFHRAGRAWSVDPTLPLIAQSTIDVFESQSGKHVRSMGANLFLMPHGLTIDHDDNIWVTDVLLHQVFKFNAKGELLLKLGEARISGNDRGHFNLPTDVAVPPDGSFYVSDGYGNSRVVKFNAKGEYQFEWGSKGKSPGEFDLPHAIDIDTEGRVYVADRSNARIQVFDAAGKFITQWQSTALGRPYSIAVSGKRAVVVDGGDQPTEGLDRSGAAVVDLNGRILTKFGQFGNYDGQFRLAHDVAIGSDGSVFVVDAWGQRVQKFQPRGHR
jgi:peptidylamidoglycolate lyase